MLRKTRASTVLSVLLLITMVLAPALSAQPAPSPVFLVDPAEGGIWGHEWAPLAEMEVRVNEALVASDTADDGGNFGTGVDPATLATGDVVEVSDGTTTKTHTITAVRIGGVDEAADTVSGTAADGSELIVEVYEQPEWTVRFETAVGGAWTADFSTPGGEPEEFHVVDLIEGSNGAAFQEDADGDQTRVHWRVPNPMFNVDPWGGGIWGHEWAPNDSVDLYVGGDLVDSPATDEWGNFGSGADPATMTHGVTVEVTQGATVKSHVITSLEIVGVDDDADTVSGKAVATSDVHVFIHEADVWRNEVTDGLGNFIADFSTPGDEPDEAATFDLVVGTNGASAQCDDDSDCTFAFWNVPNPAFSVQPPWDAWSHGEGWVEDRTLTLYVDDDLDLGNGFLFSDSTLVERWGPAPWEVGWNLHLGDDFEIMAGHVMTVYDGVGITKTLIVEALELTNVDPDLDIMEGTGPAGAIVEVDVGDGLGEGSHRTVEVAGDTTWIADFSVPWEDQPAFDIDIGTGGSAQIFDDDGDSTHDGFHLEPPPVPAFAVEIPFDVWAHHTAWVEDRVITLYVDDDLDLGNGFLFEGTTVSERFGAEPWEVEWYFHLGDEFEILPGHVVTVDDGVDITKTLIVEALELTNVDPDLDIMEGTGPAGAIVEVNVDNDFGEGSHRTVEVAGDNTWIADFSVPWEDQPAFDIDIGTGGSAQIFDDDGDSTHTGFFLEEPDFPRFTVFWDNNVIEGEGWAVHPDTLLTITIDDDDDPTNGVLFTYETFAEDGFFAVGGDEGNGEEVFDVQAGHYVVVDDGASVKDHWVTSMMFADANPDTDIVTGTAEPGSFVLVSPDVPIFVWEHLNFQYGPNNRNPDSLNEHLAFRQAVAHAIDRDAIVAAVPGAGSGIDSYVDVFLPELSQHAWAQYPYDPAAAQALLDGLCTDLGRDCVADPPVAVFTTTSDNDDRVLLADLLQAMLADVGIDFQIDLEPFEVFFGDTFNEGTFDMGEWAWVASPGFSSLVGTHNLFDPEERGDFPNAYNWGTPDSSVINAATERFAELVGLMDATDDPALLTAYIQEAELILADEMMFYPLYIRDEVFFDEGPIRVVEADEFGHWVADFSVPWEDQDVLDITEDTTGFIFQFDEDEDATGESWEVPFQGDLFVSVEDVSVAESDRNQRVAVTFYLNEPASEPVTFEWETFDGTAFAGEDYRFRSAVTTIGEGETMATTHLVIFGDDIEEDEEWFEVAIVGVEGAGIGDSGIVTILDDDDGPTLPALSVEDLDVVERDRGGEKVYLTFTLSAPAPAPVSLTYELVDDTATFPADYRSRLVSTVTIPTGATEAVRPISIRGDTLVEGTEQFFVNVTSVVGATIADPQGVVVIIDND